MKLPFDEDDPKRLQQYCIKCNPHLEGWGMASNGICQCGRNGSTFIIDLNRLTQHNYDIHNWKEK